MVVSLKDESENGKLAWLMGYFLRIREFQTSHGPGH